MKFKQKFLDLVMVANPEIFYILMRKIKPKIVVETGVSFGVTSSFILQAMEDNGFGILFN